MKAKCLCPSVLRDIGSLVTPDTLFRWHRQLVAKKYDGTRRRTGRPQVAAEIAKLVVMMANAGVEEVAPALDDGLPVLSPGWEYHTFRHALDLTAPSRAFLHPSISQSSP